jgi:RNA polymerase sigma-70 factor (ECF subfamily)
MVNNQSAKGSAPMVNEPGLETERIQRRQRVIGDLRRVFDDLYRKAGADKFGLSRDDFDDILVEVGAKYLPGGAGHSEALELYRSLRIEELALARACGCGHEPAWELFMIRYREKLYDAARSIAKEESTARELADSLYADLFGTETRDGKRFSKLIYYAGRGSLEGWLRAVLAQEFVNRHRSERRTVSLEERNEAGAQFQAPDSAAQCDDPTHVDPRLEAATDEVLTALPAEDRFILACYYLDERSLAEIGRMLGVHESTISRRVAKITERLSKGIVKALVNRGMSRRQAEEALQVDVRDFSFDVRKSLLKNKVARDEP